MSLFGYPDFDRPLDFNGGRIFYPFGGGAFLLVPNRCSVAALEDGRINFCLDLIRSAAWISATEAHAILEFRVSADYATDAALAYLRKDHPRAVLSPCVLTNWEFRLAPGPTTTDEPHELLTPTLLASDGLGLARLVLRLSIESGLLLESLLENGDAPVHAIAEAEMVGVSPRVPAVARLRTSTLLPPLIELTGDDSSLPRQAIVNFFLRDLSALPVEVTGEIADRITAFGEAMADRVIARYGRYVSASPESLEPLVQLQPVDGSGDSDIFWSLSEPFLTSRRILLHFDLLSDVRQRMQSIGIDSFVRRHTLSSLPSLGQSVVTVLCNLPIERVGVAELGVTLLFPPKPPDRPQPQSISALFEPPGDLVDVAVQLAPGESQEYQFSTFAVIADEQGSRDLKGPDVSHSGSPLKLSPEDFPVDFFQIEVAQGLAAIASVNGACEYERDGRQYSIPFTLDSGRLTASLALPKERASASVRCAAIARDGSGALSLGPFETPSVRLDLSTFAEYGSQEVEIECLFDGETSLCAIDLSSAGRDETSTLAFTTSQPTRTFRWFAQSPFQAGFRYRPHRDNGTPAAWREVPSPGARLVIHADELQPDAQTEAVAISESAARTPLRMTPQPTSEGAQIVPEGSATVVPISPEAEPTDLLLYSHPDDPAKKFYIPRYWVDEQTVSGQDRYRIAMTQQGSTATLTIHLLAGPAPSLGDAARDAEEFPHAISITLNYLQSPPSGALKTLPFEEVTRSGSSVTASMTFATLQERDEVFRGLTDPDRDTSLIVKRIIDVSLPQSSKWIFSLPKIATLLGSVALPPRPIGVQLQRDTPTPNKANVLTTRNATSLRAATMRRIGEAAPMQLRARSPLGGAALIRTIPRTTPQVRDIRLPVSLLPIPVLAFVSRDGGTGKDATICKLSITNWKSYATDFFQASPDLPPCGANANASRTWVDVCDADTDARLYSYGAIYSPNNLAEVFFSAPTGKVPERVYVQLQDRRTKMVQKSNVVDTRSPQAGAPSYLEARRELDCSVEPTPFVFHPDLHGYIFQGIVPGGEGSQLVRFRLAWKDTFHTYLQDAARPNVVYFFPDEFKIARRREAPFTPFITVRIVSRTGLADADVVFDYIVAPYTNTKRLADAQAALLKDPAFGAPGVQFQPFFTKDVRFFIDRPVQQGTVREERSGASLVLQGALKDTLVMTVPDFQILFDAMHRDTASLFLGRVEIDVPHADTEVIPFTGRMDDLEGELFLYEATARADGGIDVSLTNATESPLRINVLDASVSRGGRTCKGLVESPALPVQSLPPGGAIQVKVTPETPLAGAEAPEVKMFLEGVAALPDPAAVWDAILDRSTLAYFDTVTVKAIANLFEPIPGRENDQIVVILVEFEGGGTAELKASQLEAEVRIDYPIDDVILRRSITSVYRYTTTVIRADGRQDRDADPRQQSARIFFVNAAR